jgi:transcriptional regulator GlxA family with amidase domain
MQETLDDLIAFIQANLDQPLNLAILENYTHYSKRALQYAFRQRLGCTVSQWIRSQRLDLAYQCLQQAETRDSVTSIALRCGYRSISLFSIDFQQRFHIKPSHLLRQGRQPS